MFFLNWDENMVSNDAKMGGIINMVGGRSRTHLDFDYLGRGKIRFTTAEGKLMLTNPTVKIKN